MFETRKKVQQMRKLGPFHFKTKTKPKATGTPRHQTWVVATATASAGKATCEGASDLTYLNLTYLAVEMLMFETGNSQTATTFSNSIMWNFCRNQIIC